MYLKDRVATITGSCSVIVLTDIIQSGAMQPVCIVISLHTLCVAMSGHGPVRFCHHIYDHRVR